MINRADARNMLKYVSYSDKIPIPFAFIWINFINKYASNIELRKYLIQFEHIEKFVCFYSILLWIISDIEGWL